MADPKVTHAKRIVTTAQKEAQRISGDLARSRSTRTRAAYKVKAQALDKIGEILAK